MNLKERIIRAKIARLDPDEEASQIATLKARLAATAAPAAAEKEEPPESPAPFGERFVPTAAGVENFRALNSEVHIRSREWGDIWLVPLRTGAGRFELLPEEILLLAQAREMFGATIVEVTKNVPA
mgnify:CR=1 FL=1|jgi:hypothetical protein